MFLIKLGCWIVGVALTFVVLFGLATRLTVPDSNVSVHPSDQTLEDNLRQHQAEFNELIKMSNLDPRVIRIADDFTWLDTNANWPRPDSEIGFSKERWDEYRRAFHSLGLKYGLMRPMDTESIFLIVSSAGTVSSGSSKGYAYSIMPLSPLVDSLQETSIAHQHAVYKKLSDNWYLFLQRN